MEDRIRSKNLNFLNHDLESFQGRREKFAVDLRKEKRSKNICKKRKQTSIMANDDVLDCLPPFPFDVLQYLPTEFESLPMINKLERISEALKNKIPDQAKEYMIEKVDNLIRKNKLDLKFLYSIGFANSLMNLLHIQSLANINKLSMYILGCILDSNDECKLDLFNNGLLDKVIPFVCPEEVNVLDYTIWVLASISDEKKVTVVLLRDGILIRLMKLYNDINSYINSDIVDSYGILLSNITMHYYEICREDAKIICQIVLMIMKNKEFNMTGFIRTLSHLCRNDSLIEIVIGSTAVEYALEIIGISENTELVFELLGSISSGSTIQTEYIFQHNILDTCFMYVNSDSKDVLKNIMIIINNIISESSTYIPLVILHDIFPCILAKLLYNAENVRVEVSYLLLTIMTRANDSDTFHIINMKLAIYLEQALKFNEAEFLYNCLIISSKILNFLRLYPDFIELVDATQILLVIGNLTTHTNEKVSELAEAILSSSISSQSDEVC